MIRSSHLIILCLLLCCASGPAQAWDKHTRLMPQVVSLLPETIQQRLAHADASECVWNDGVLTKKLEDDLTINLTDTLANQEKAGPCRRDRVVRLTDILTGSAVDEPDLKMDLALKGEVDPAGDRPWMGGEQSDGFRHMYFVGWDLARPIITLQIPLRTLGQAPQRVQLLAQRARDLYVSGKTAWAMRVAAWAAHYMQDLSQPFHVIQIPNLKMLMWSQLWQRPFGTAFDRFVDDSSRTVENYHLAFEYKVLQSQMAKSAGLFQQCIALASVEARNALMQGVVLNHRRDVDQLPYFLAIRVANHSVDFGKSVGKSTYDYFGGLLKEPKMKLGIGEGWLEAAATSEKNAVPEVSADLDEAACMSMAHGIAATSLLIEWVVRSESDG